MLRDRGPFNAEPTMRLGPALLLILALSAGGWVLAGYVLRPALSAILALAMWAGVV